MLNSGKKFRASRDKKNKYSNSCVVRKKNSERIIIPFKLNGRSLISGTLLGKILHTRLRMNNSSLNEHLFIRNLMDSPNCACGQVESTSHFLI